MSKREEFVEKFGESEAAAFEAAANEHRNWMADTNPGSDPFRWAMLVVIGFECGSKYSEEHSINAPWGDVDAWLKEPAQREWLADHDGGFDSLSMLAGTYNEYMPEKEDPEA